MFELLHFDLQLPNLSNERIIFFKIEKTEIQLCKTLIHANAEKQKRKSPTIN